MDLLLTILIHLTGQNAAEIEKLSAIHYLKEEMRSPYDKIEMNGAELIMSAWRDLPPEPNAQKEECLGYQWLLAGRGARLGFGAAEIFRRFPQIQTVTLLLSDLQFELKSTDQGRGHFERAAKPQAILKLQAERSRLDKTPSQFRWKEELGKSLDQCLKIGRDYITKREIFL